MTVRAGALIDANDLVLPAEVSSSFNGVNTLSSAAATWAALTNDVAVTITNSHPTRGLRVLVTFGAWLVANGSAVRLAVAATGGLVFAGGPGTDGPLAWGEIPYLVNQAAGTNWQKHSSFTSVLPAATTTTFQVQAYRDVASGTENVSYPALRAIPLHYV